MTERNDRIEAALAERLSRSGGIPTVAPGPAPLSPVQRSLWILAQLAQGEPVNNRPLHLRLRGGLDVDALTAALVGLVERHMILRSTFPMVDGGPVQVVGDRPRLDLGLVDLSGSEDPEAEARQFTDRHAETVFDLTAESPFRPRLLRLAPTDHVLTVAMHHIVFDGWSERRFVDELAALYDAAIDGGDAGLAPLSVQVRDAAAWLAGRADEEAERNDLAWWEERLSDLPPDLELPVDRPPLDAVPGDPVTIDLGSELTGSLAELARRHDATPFMVITAAVQALITRLTGQSDVVVGVPSAGRPRPETEPLIGCFIDTIAVRSRVDLDEGFGDLLTRARTNVLDALSHTAVPFSRVLGAVRPWAGGDRTPIYRVHVQFRNFPGEVRESRHLGIEPFGVLPGSGSHLSVRAEEMDGSWRVALHYDPSRFRRATIVRWAGALRRLLTSAAVDQSAPIGDIQLMSADELALVSGGWDGQPEWEEPPVLAADRLRAIAGRLPDAPAIVHGDRTLTFAEFDRMVDRFASALQARELGGEDSVVLFLDRSPEAAVAVFGALRAGVAYVPVDSELAAEWLATVIEQVQPGLVLVDAHRRAEIAGLTSRAVTVQELVEQGSGRPACSPQAGDLAYILYTSGSTGVPKGVMVEQGNLAAYLAADHESEPIGPGHRVIWFHSMSFDGVAKGLHAPLAYGATIVIRDEEAARSVPRFLAWCEQLELTHLPVPTSYAHVLLEEAVALGADIPERISLITFGGEQVRHDLVEAWLARYGDRPVLRNTYGPTEATVWLCSASLTSAGAPFGRIPIGRPSRSVKVRVRDPRGNLTPVGVFGELLLGGPLVTRGYLGAPDLTAERFHTDADGVRWYHSGDLGRWLPNGTLEVVGRLDRQVKIRGYRVEPGEIESALRAIPGVADAAAIVLPSFDGNLALHAYAETELEPATLMDRLATELPTFLRPATVTTLKRFPRSVSGKLDARQLPEPGTVEMAEAAGPDESAPGVLEAVRAIWCEVLGVDTIEPGDGFFALGGHSLLAIRVISRIRDRLGVEVPLPSLFTHPTLGELAALAAELGAGDLVVPTPAPEPASAPTPAASAATDDLDALLDEIEQLSDEEAAALLAALEAEGAA